MQTTNLGKLHNSGKIATASQNKELIMTGSTLRPKRGKTLTCAALA